MDHNLALTTDSYKPSHFLQYPPETDALFAYFESRGGKFPATLAVGLRAIVFEYLTHPVTMDDVLEAASEWELHGEPFPLDGWKRIVTKHKGYLPIIIRAVPEGSLVPTHNVLFTVESTDDQIPWIATWVETFLSRAWHPFNVATISFNCKKAILKRLIQTSDDPFAEVNWKLHDFGARGSASGESAAIGGIGHLANFFGSDTMEAVHFANKVYGCKGKMSGRSIPAAEHSTIISWGKDREEDAYRNFLDKFAKKGAVIACVSDSYNLWNAIDNMWGGSLRQRVIDSGSTLVIRPDSGDPAEVVLQTLQHLDAKFGHVVNKKGYKVLNNVRVIQGDGVTIDSIPGVLDLAIKNGYSATNIAFGMGGGLHSKHDRDTQKFAYKVSSVHYSGSGWHGCSKDPITDPGKKSKAGRLTLTRDDKGYRTVEQGPDFTARLNDCMETVYPWNLAQRTTLDEIRQRANTALTPES
jgi:nicotinamide phosphoribosyltransferase